MCYNQNLDCNNCTISGNESRGCKVEDEEHYHVSGTWNFCPQCGKRVWPKK